jgi:hypothetical protein
MLKSFSSSTALSLAAFYREKALPKIIKDHFCFSMVVVVVVLGTGGLNSGLCAC